MVSCCLSFPIAPYFPRLLQSDSKSRRNPINHRSGQYMKLDRRLSAGIIGLIILIATVGGVLYFKSESTLQQLSSSTIVATINTSELLKSGSPPIRGSLNASVTIVEFGDFQCPTCGAWYHEQEPLVLQNLVDSGKAQFEWRDFDFFGPDSVSASEAAYCAGEQGKFWQFYDIVYSNQQTPNSGWADFVHLQKFAEQLGLNMTQFNTSFQSHKYAALVNMNYALGTQLGITATPTFFVVGASGKIVTITGDQPYSVFEASVNSLSGT